MDKRLVRLWAKTSKANDSLWHPLIQHMLDVATSAETILLRELDSLENGRDVRARVRSRSLVRFFFKLKALMMVASTIVLS